MKGEYTDEFTLNLSEFNILETGADGGHKYVTTVIDYKGEKKSMAIFFLSKDDERKLEPNTPIKLKGKLVDEGTSNSLLLLDAILL